MNRWGFNVPTLVMVALCLLLTFLVLYPLVMVAYGSFWSEAPGTPGQFTLKGYSQIYSDPQTYLTLWTTLWLAAVRVVLATAVAVFFAWVVTRTDTPRRKLFEVLIWLQCFLPIQPVILAWIMLAAPDSGLINQALTGILPIGSTWLELGIP